MTRDSQRTSNTPGRLLAAHSGALGDVILLGHLVRLVDPHATVLAGGEKARLLVGLGAGGRALDFDALPIHELFTDAPLTQCRLPALLGEHERLISCFGQGDRRAEQRLAAACGAGSAAFLPTRPPEAFRGHLLGLWCDMLGVDAEATRHGEPWPVPDTWRDQARQMLAQWGPAVSRPYVLLAPGAGAESKRWPLERFLTVAAQLARSGLPPVFLVGPVEQDRWPEEDFDTIRASHPLVVSPPLGTLAGLAAGARAVLANDSGTGHLAAAVGAATVSLFGPTRSDHFAPRGRCVTVIARPSLDAIAPADVLHVLRALGHATER